MPTETIGWQKKSRSSPVLPAPKIQHSRDIASLFKANSFYRRSTPCRCVQLLRSVNQRIRTESGGRRVNFRGGASKDGAKSAGSDGLKRAYRGENAEI